MEFRVVSVSLALLLLIRFHSAHSQYAGDTCVHQASGKSGVCKSVAECPMAIQQLKKQRLPQTCSFEGTLAIVCCPLELQTMDRLKTIGLKSKQKCTEYAKHVFTTYASPVSTGELVENKTRNECGFKIIELIVGGTKAKGKEFPHMAAIGYDSSDGLLRVYHCGGSLISKNYVVTAGHCSFTTINKERRPATSVRLGDLNLVTDDDNADPQEINIAQWIKCPEFNPPQPYSDIALIRLESDVRFTPYVRPICLPTVKQQDSESAIASGWGRTGSTEKQSDDLLKVTLDVFSQQECSGAFTPNARRLKDGIVEDSQICAGSKKDDFKDTCPGDSGGPLQIYNADEYCMYTIIGITSFGKVCGASHSPGVYTRVSHFVEWIEETVWP